MEEWISANKIPLGTWMSNGVDLLKQNAQSFFDACRSALAFLINGLTQALLVVPPLLLIVLITGAVYALHRS
jgi:glycine betaine/proline transport system permease protein